jgi:C-terminal processing protease CtpA/Prc
MSKNICRTFIIIFALLTVSCEKVFLGKEIDNQPRQNFDYLWLKVETGYSFFDIKDVQWDSLYQVYSPLIKDEITDVQLFDHLAQLLNELKDGHVNLYSPFKTSRYDISMLGPVNIDFRLIRDNYLTGTEEITGPFVHGFPLNNEVGYIRYSSFSNTVTSQHFEYMLSRFKDTRGLIFDIRQNGGGYIENVFTIISRFIDKKTITYYSSIKTSYGGAYDSTFSAPEAVLTEPAQGTTYTKPVIVLTDRGSYSASSFFAVSCLAIPHVTLMGDTTGGGLGLPSGGQLPNGWTYRFPVTRTISVDGRNLENGVPPDIHITLLPDHNVTGTDNIMDAAIDKILN